MKQDNFGALPDGRGAVLYTLSNSRGMEVAISNYGATIVSIKVPDHSGKIADVVLGFDTLDGYLNPKEPYFGAIVGRYGNRIANGAFTLDGTQYALARNNGENSLHGGLKGFDKQIWQSHAMNSDDGPGVQLSYASKDGEEGFPGALTTTVTYTLTSNNELKIDYEATTDKDTVLNLTNHSYFNLAGQGNGDILDHILMIDADRFTPVNASMIPTGELRSVAGTPFDFRKPTAIGARINDPDQQLQLGSGYDHNFVLNHAAGTLALAARVTDPKSGRTLEVSTTQPGVQLYTSNFLDGTLHGKGGIAYQRRSAFCLETQHFPDSPNQPNFPTVVLKPGEKFHSTTVFKFSA